MIEIKKISVHKRSVLSGKKEIYTKKAPAAVGPYSQAVLSGSTVYLSGQIALDPKTGELENDNIETETNQVLANLSAVLEAGGATINDVVKVDIFITNINDFGAVNTIYEKWLKKAEIKPARQTVEVSALPKGARVEISCVARIN